MQQFIGVKIVDAEKMTLGAYNEHRGWTIPADEDPLSPGYLVQYPDGYISWCPTVQFEEANRLTTGMPFGLAIEAAKKGNRIARVGWNGKSMFVYLVDGSTIPVDQCRGACADAVAARFKEGESQRSHQTIGSHFDMMAADGSIVVGWLASQTDMLADDWQIV